MNKKRILGLILITCILLLIIILIASNILKKENINLNSNDEVRQNLENLNVEVKDYYDYNEFKYNNISTDNLLRMYLVDYKNECLENPQNAYEKLNKEYREKKFETLSSYIQYINENKEQIIGAKVEKFKVNNYDTYNEYIIEDQYGNYYIFNVTAVMEYTVMLDNYTVAGESFKEEYNKLDNEEKAVMNLKRFLIAIEDRDYKYAYSKLYSTFKTNNFPTQIDFENYIQQNIIKDEDIQNVQVENQSGIYICKLSIVDENKVETKRNFMIQLAENTEYQISFEI